MEMRLEKYWDRAKQAARNKQNHQAVLLFVKSSRAKDGIWETEKCQLLAMKQRLMKRRSLKQIGLRRKTMYGRNILDDMVQKLWTAAVLNPAQTRKTSMISKIGQSMSTCILTVTNLNA